MAGEERLPLPEISSKAILRVAFAILILVVAWMLYSYATKEERREALAASNLDTVADVIRLNSNRVEVMTLSGNVTTVRNDSGGPFGVFEGKLVIRQPFSVGYFVDMRQLSLADYRWDEAANTLFVRLPPVTPDRPNIDATRQEASTTGWVITRDMQQRLRAGVARGAANQVTVEANKPENLQKANEAAQAAISRNLELPLRQAGVRNARVQVVYGSRSTERWDVSRSIAEVLAERAGN